MEIFWRTALATTTTTTATMDKREEQQTTEKDNDLDKNINNNNRLHCTDHRSLVGPLYSLLRIVAVGLISWLASLYCVNDYGALQLERYLPANGLTTALRSPR